MLTGNQVRLRRLWNEKVTRSIALADDEKKEFIDAYWRGTLPSVEGFSLAQWVEDGCRSFDACDGR